MATLLARASDTRPGAAGWLAAGSRSIPAASAWREDGCLCRGGEEPQPRHAL